MTTVNSVQNFLAHINYPLYGKNINYGMPQTFTPPVLKPIDSFISQTNIKPNTNLSPVYLMSPSVLTATVGPKLNFQFKISHYMAIDRLKKMTPYELKQLGQTNKMEFFKALLPAAKESEARYGVPAAVTLAQAALESGWCESPIGKFNIFGIKGKGPAGTTSVRTKEWNGSGYISIYDKFALYNNFYEAVMEHGKLFHNGYYKKGLNEFALNKDPIRFIDNIARTYATSPTYASSIKGIIRNYNLLALTAYNI